MGPDGQAVDGRFHGAGRRGHSEGALRMIFRNIPELDREYGYYYALGLILALIFRRIDWLWQPERLPYKNSKVAHYQTVALPKTSRVFYTHPKVSATTSLAGRRCETGDGM